MDLGFITHTVHANARLVYLVVSSWDNGRLDFFGPPSTGVYPPGPAWISVIIGGVPSKMFKVMVGDGRGPEVNMDAISGTL